jgi:pilus assembly protein CpaB
MKNKMMEFLKIRFSPPIIMLVAALLIAGIVSYLSYGLLQKKTATQTASADTQQVAVAAFEIKWGTVITQEIVKTQPYMKGSLPVGYIADPSAAIGRVVIYPMQINEPFTESKLAPASVKMGGVAAIVSPKKRAMAVKVDKVIGVSGFIHPGNRVDVLVSLPKSESLPQAITKIVLENVPVLAVGTEFEQAAGKKEKPAQVDVITLEVSPEEGEKLALAATEGKLQLALRNYTDMEDVKTRGTSIPALLTSYVGGTAAPAKQSATVRRGTRSAPAGVDATAKQRAASPAPTGSYTVELIKGSKVSEVNFSKGGE